MVRGLVTEQVRLPVDNVIHEKLVKHSEELSQLSDSEFTFDSENISWFKDRSQTKQRRLTNRSSLVKLAKPFIYSVGKPFNFKYNKSNSRMKVAEKVKGTNKFEQVDVKVGDQNQLRLKHSNKESVWKRLVMMARTFILMRTILKAFKLSEKKKNIAPDDSSLANSSFSLATSSSCGSFSAGLNESNLSMMTKSAATKRRQTLKSLSSSPKSTKSSKSKNKNRASTLRKRYQTSPPQFELYDESDRALYSTDLVFEEVRRRNAEAKKLRALSEEYDELDSLSDAEEESQLSEGSFATLWNPVRRI